MAYFIEISRDEAEKAVARRQAELVVVKDGGWERVEDGDVWGASHMEYFPKEEKLRVASGGEYVFFCATGDNPFTAHFFDDERVTPIAYAALDDAGIKYRTVLV